VTISCKIALFCQSKPSLVTKTKCHSSRRCSFSSYRR